MNNQRPQLNVNINPDLVEDVVCEKCECQSFTACYIIKKVPALVSPTGKEVMMPVETFSCLACGHINKEFVPDLKK
tara:strand:+ start:651 stop:878 length:228 start_codon:yes stop_codon:yes gene_type:complete